MSERNNADLHTLKKIQWKELQIQSKDSEQQRIKDEILVEMDKNIPINDQESTELRLEIADLLAEAIIEISKVLSIDEEIHVAIKPLEDSSSAHFIIENGKYTVVFSKEVVTRAYIL